MRFQKNAPTSRASSAISFSIHYMVMRPMPRREFLAAAAAGGSLMLLRSAYGAPERKLEGIFPIMQTPFTDAGALDVETLAHEAQFLDRIGVQGMTWPQLASEYVALTF